MVTTLAPMGNPRQALKYQQDADTAVKLLKPPTRTHRLHLPKVSKSVDSRALEIRPARQLELNACMPGEDLLQVFEALDKTLETVDELSQFAKVRQCSNEDRKVIFALKNMVLTILWEQRRDIFRGYWQHTSQGAEQRCWTCDGTGDGQSFGEPCEKCKGTGKWKVGSPMILSVFALESFNYATTWHIPSQSVHSLLGPIEYGEDMVQSRKWVSADLRKTPQFFTTEQYEERRSFLAWFILKAKAQSDRLYFLRR